MTYAALPVQIQHLAENVLTPAQLETWRLELHGMSQWDIAYRLDISRSAVRDRLRAGWMTLHRHGVRQDADGTWYLEETA